MNDFNRKVEGASARVSQTINEAAERLATFGMHQSGPVGVGHGQDFLAGGLALSEFLSECCV